MSKINEYKQMMNEIKLPGGTYIKLMDLPNDSKRKQNYRLNQRKAVWRFAAACLVLTLMCGGTAYAAFHYLSSSQIAEHMGTDSLKNLFTSSKSVKINETQEFEDYQVTYLGMADTTDVQKYGLKGDFESDTMYSVLAVKRTDGAAMEMPTQDNKNTIDLYVTPMIRGTNPMKVNAFTMNGSVVKMVKDGVLYILYSQNTLEKFADTGVYLAVMNGKFYCEEAYMSKESGEFTRNPDYKGINALFEMPLNHSLSNKEEAKRLLDFWSDQTKEKSKINLTHCWNNWSDSYIEEMFAAFGNQVCVKRDNGDAFVLDFYTMNGDKLADSVQLPISGAYIKTYSTRQYVVAMTERKENRHFVVINEKHEIVINREFEKKMELSEDFLIAPDLQKIFFWKESEDKEGCYFEISSCNYDGSECQSIYKVYVDKKETTRKLEGISDAKLSKDGKTIFFVGEYFESRESGSSSKLGTGAIDIETGKMKFVHGGNDSIADTLENEAVYISNSGANSDVVFMDGKGKCRSIQLEKSSELPYVYVSGDGKMIYTVSEKLAGKNRLSHVVKCYRVSDNKVLWSSQLDSTYAVRSLINNGKLLVLCANEEGNQCVMMGR